MENFDELEKGQNGVSSLSKPLLLDEEKEEHDLLGNNGIISINPRLNSRTRLVRILDNDDDNDLAFLLQNHHNNNKTTTRKNDQQTLALGGYDKDGHSDPHGSGDNRNSTNGVAGTTYPSLTSGGHMREKYQNAFFAFLFLIHLLLILAIALTYGVVALSHISSHYLIIKSTVTIYDSSYDSMPNKFVLGMMLILALASCLSLGWVYLLDKTASYIYYTLLLLLVGGSTAGGLGLLSIGYPFLALPLFLVVVGALVSAWIFQDYIQFATLHLQLACRSILSTSSTIVISLTVLAVESVYCIIWCIAVVGFATNAYKITKVFGGNEYTLDECVTYQYANSFKLEDESTTLTCPSGQICHACLCDNDTVLVANSSCSNPRFYIATFTILVLSLLWTHSVVTNIVHVTTAGSVWEWWRNGFCRVDQTLRYLTRACTTSLGSICLGSLLSALLRLVRLIVYALVRLIDDRKRNDPALRRSSGIIMICRQYFLLALLDLISFLDHLLSVFNRYAFCYLAIEEMSYQEASAAASQLFASHQLTALGNNDMLEVILQLIAASNGGACMTAAYLYCKVVNLTHGYSFFLAIVGMIAGYLISTIVFAPLTSAVATIYIAYLRDSAAFEKAHPDIYPRLHRAWQRLFNQRKYLSESQQFFSSKGGEAVMDKEMEESGARFVYRGSYQPTPEPTPSNSKVFGFAGTDGWMSTLANSIVSIANRTKSPVDPLDQDQQELQGLL